MKQGIEHVGFSIEEHGHIQTVDPDFAQIYADLDGKEPQQPAAEPEQPLGLAGEGLREILTWIYHHRTGHQPMQTVLRRLTVITALLRPELVGNRTFREIGCELGCTRACLCKIGVAFSRQFGVHFRRKHNGRGNMALAMTRSHQRRKQHENHNPNQLA